MGLVPDPRRDAVGGCVDPDHDPPNRTLSMAVYCALPAKFAELHLKFKTPWFSTTVMGAAAIVYYVGMSIFSEDMLADPLTSMGLWRLRPNSRPFFQGESLNRDTPVLVPDE